MVNYWKKFWLLFFRPKLFIKTIEKENSYLPILLFYGIPYVLISLISNLFSGDAFTIITSFIFDCLIIFVGSFVSAGIIHLGVKILGGKKGYFNTFKPDVYSSAVFLPYYLVLSLLLIGAGLNTNGENIDPNEIGKYLWAIAIMVPVLLIGIIHSAYVAVIGISRFQKISKTRAFLAAIIFPVLYFLIIMIIIIILAVIIGSFLYLN